MSKRIAISQSNYIPWKGYFDMVARVDEFILYDEAQFTKNDWRNRNKIKTPRGLQWLTIPVNGSTSKKINEVEIANPEWRTNHWKTIYQFYKNAPFFSQYSDAVKKFYDDAVFKKLSDINYHFLTGLNELLDIQTLLKRSSDFNIKGSATEKVVYLCKQAEADIYVSGPAAKNYLELEKFQEAKIEIEWMDYENYTVYEQQYEPFEHGVSILDLLFNTGSEARNYMKY